MINSTASLYAYEFPMKIVFLLILLPISNVWAIDSCSEHNYCAPQGNIHITVAPKVAKENMKFCKGASFKIEFSLKNGTPYDVVVKGGSKELHDTIKSSFIKWKFGAVFPINKAVETVSLESDCSIKYVPNW